MTNRPVSRKKNIVEGKGKIEKHEAVETINKGVKKKECVSTNILNVFKGKKDNKYDEQKE